MWQRLLPFCSHKTPNQGQTGATTPHQHKTSNCPPQNVFRERSEGYRSWPSRTHNPKVAGSNPAPATIRFEGLADARAASPFRLPRLHPGISAKSAGSSSGAPESQSVMSCDDAPQHRGIASTRQIPRQATRISNDGSSARSRLSAWPRPSL